MEEAPELLQIIEDGLLTLRAERTSAKVHDIMRAAHSLKGGAASVELPTIKDLAHRLEDIFKAFSCNGTLKGCVSQELQKGPKDSMQALINATEPEPRKLHV